ncbi:BON domain-containing protein [Paraburkholderia fungorum]|uniref:BON domain-containing protein n=1 Tax=Paraburkholderia fungorum TaxID=134537 RepID=A0A1H1JQ85_9BURK|nr:BON domain-containing protein [Paraburkholderia fungorum]SDR52158.1 BON domain-containing protein [Paraburkholderia fungorum]
MNAVRFVKLVGSTAIVLGCLDAHAQPAAPAQSTSNSARVAKDANRQLARDVRRALKDARNQGLRFRNITVRANNGVVSLSGSVPEVRQIDLAINAARNVPGVQSVNNRLAVRSEIAGRGSQ